MLARFGFRQRLSAAGHKALRTDFMDVPQRQGSDVLGKGVAHVARIDHP